MQALVAKNIVGSRCFQFSGEVHFTNNINEKQDEARDNRNEHDCIKFDERKRVREIAGKPISSECRRPKLRQLPFEQWTDDQCRCLVIKNKTLQNSMIYVGIQEK